MTERSLRTARTPSTSPSTSKRTASISPSLGNRRMPHDERGRTLTLRRQNEIALVQSLLDGKLIPPGPAGVIEQETCVRKAKEMHDGAPVEDLATLARKSKETTPQNSPQMSRIDTPKGKGGDSDKGLAYFLDLKVQPGVCPKAGNCPELHSLSHRLALSHKGYRSNPIRCRDGVGCAQLKNKEHLKKYAHDDDIMSRVPKAPDVTEPAADASEGNQVLGLGNQVFAFNTAGALAIWENQKLGKDEEERKEQVKRREEREISEEERRVKKETKR